MNFYIATRTSKHGDDVFLYQADFFTVQDFILLLGDDFEDGEETVNVQKVTPIKV